MQSDHISSDSRWIGNLRKQLQGAEVPLVAELTTTNITLRQVLHMKPGDIITVNIPDTIIASVDGVPLIECRYGLQNNQYALKIERFIAEDTLQDNNDLPEGESHHG